LVGAAEVFGGCVGFDFMVLQAFVPFAHFLIFFGDGPLEASKLRPMPVTGIHFIDRNPAHCKNPQISVIA
jgi:hypothetical protein